MVERGRLLKLLLKCWSYFINMIKKKGNMVCIR